MTRLFKPVAVLCAVALLAGSRPLLSHPGSGSPHPEAADGFAPGSRMMERMADTLGLTDAQRAQLQAILTRYQSAGLHENMKALFQARTQMSSLVGDPSANEQQVVEAARSVAAQSEQVALQRHRMAVEIDSILTDDQRQKAKEMRAERAAKPGHFHPGSGGPRHGA